MAIPEREPWRTKWQSTTLLIFLLVLAILVYLLHTTLINGGEFMQGLLTDCGFYGGKKAADNFGRAKYGGE